MNQQDANTIIRNGSRYEYDADFDVYRRVPEPSELTHMSQYGWIYVTAILCAICYYVQFTR